MTVTIEEEAIANLLNINRPTSVNNIMSMVCWAASENSQATWNTWDTEEIEPGDTDFNSAGVKDYPTQAKGQAAFKATILNGKYADILAAFDASEPPAVTCSIITNSPWGSQPTSQLVALVLSDYSYYAAKPVAGSTDTAPTTEETTVATRVPDQTVSVGEDTPIETTAASEAASVTEPGGAPATAPDNQPIQAGDPTPTVTELAAPIVAAFVPADGQGYIAVGADGGVYAQDGAAFYGSIPEAKIELNAPIVAAFASGRGYVLIAADGGAFNFGSAAATPVVP